MNIFKWDVRKMMQIILFNIPYENVQGNKRKKLEKAFIYNDVNKLDMLWSLTLWLYDFIVCTQESCPCFLNILDHMEFYYLSSNCIFPLPWHILNIICLRIIKKRKQKRGFIKFRQRPPHDAYTSLCRHIKYSTHVISWWPLNDCHTSNWLGMSATW